MQYRSPVGGGPSGNTCPRWALHSLHFTSVRSMPSELSPASTTFSLAIGAQKLGHPVPESNLVDELNNARLQQIQRKIPLLCSFQVAPVYAISVSARRVMS